MQYGEIVAGLPRFFDNGLSSGVKNDDGQVCVMAAIMAVEHGLGPDGIVTDTADCVGSAVRAFAIRLNDAAWSSPSAHSAAFATAFDARDKVLTRCAQLAIDVLQELGSPGCAFLEAK